MKAIRDWLLRGPIRKVSVFGLLVTTLIGIASLWGWVDADTEEKLLKTWAMLGPTLVALGVFVATSQTTLVKDPRLTPDQIEAARVNLRDGGG